MDMSRKVMPISGRPKGMKPLIPSATTRAISVSRISDTKRRRMNRLLKPFNRAAPGILLPLSAA
jgi:hypothetical protein